MADHRNDATVVIYLEVYHDRSIEKQRAFDQNKRQHIVKHGNVEDSTGCTT